jgi:hypothetical protein
MNAVAAAAHATAEDWARFLKPVAMAVRNTPSDPEFRARVAAIAHALHVPAAWLAQPWRQAEAMRRFQFWPAVFDIAEMFEDDLKAERERRDRRERLAISGPKQVAAALAGPKERTPEEIEAVRAKAREAIAALHADTAQRSRTPARAAPLSEGALLDGYRALAAQGSSAAAARVAAIELRLGRDA